MTLEERIKRIETFLQVFCALQLVHQGLVPASEEERESLEYGIAETLEQWKNES